MSWVSPCVVGVPLFRGFPLCRGVSCRLLALSGGPGRILATKWITARTDLSLSVCANAPLLLASWLQTCRSLLSNSKEPNGFWQWSWNPAPGLSRSPVRKSLLPDCKNQECWNPFPGLSLPPVGLTPTSADRNCPIVKNPMVSDKRPGFKKCRSLLCNCKERNWFWKILQPMSWRLLAPCAGLASKSADRCCPIVKNAMVSDKGFGTNFLASSCFLCWCGSNSADRCCPQGENHPTRVGECRRHSDVMGKGGWVYTSGWERPERMSASNAPFDPKH